MKPGRAVALCVIAILIVGNLGLDAQEARPGTAPIPSGPITATAPGTGKDSCSPPTCKLCVSEPKPTAKKVYACKDEEYCLPYGSLLSLLQGKCACDGGGLGELRVRHRLVVKKVDSSAPSAIAVRSPLSSP